MKDPRQTYLGAKALVFAGDQLIVLRRDHAPGLVWPGYLDLPGGGREGDEAPAVCTAREVEEEIGLIISPEALRFVHLRDTRNAYSWFFAVHLPSSALEHVRFGGEGEGWQAMAPAAFVAADDAIPPFRDIVQGYLSQEGRSAKTRSGQ